MASQNDIGALHYEKNDTPTPASIGAIHKAPSASLSHVLLKPARGIELNRIHPLARGLVGCWLMNEGTGKTAFDLSGNGNTGTLINTPTWSAGKHGSALNFNGSSDYIQLAKSSNTIISTNFTIGGFVNTTSTAPDDAYNERIITFFRTDLANTRFALGLKGTKANLLYVTTGPVFNYLTSSESYNDGLWHFFLATYDGTTFRLYVDGTEKANVTATLITDNGTRKPEIGMFYISNTAEQRGAWDGLIDHVMVFSRALSASEVVLLYREPFCMFDDGISLANLFVETAGANYGAAMYHHLQQLGIYS